MVEQTIVRTMERVDKLLELQWHDNPKTHQDALLAHSIEKYGFDDPVTIAQWPDGESDTGSSKMLVAGHGRTFNLQAMMVNAKPLPRHCEVAEDGMWLVPADNITFPDKETAILYALMHNRSGTAKLMPEDYDPAKLRAALGAQNSLPGFTDEDMMQGGVGALAQFDLSKYQPFDASALPDAAPPVSSVPETFILFVTFRSYGELKHALEILSLGARKSLAASAKMASLEGAEHIEQWEHALSLRQVSAPETSMEKAIKENESIVPIELNDVVKESDASAEIHVDSAKQGADISVNAQWDTLTA